MDNASLEREKLLSLIKQRAVEVREQGFLLASGIRSNLYVDLRRISQDPMGINLTGRLVLSKIREIAPSARFVGGLETGSIPIATAVSLLSLEAGPPISAFWVRKKQKDHGLENMIEGNLEPGRDAVIVDDTVTTGGSSLQASEAVKHFGARVILAIAVVDRGARGNFESAGIPYFSIFAENDLS
ncbi:MAG: orotate phosphoribosyltransferase [Nitrososphaerales archaeon]